MRLGPTLEDLLDGLKEKTSTLTADVRSRYLTLGAFVESLETCFAEVLEVGVETRTEGWHARLRERGANVHAADFKVLEAIRSRRNQLAHPNVAATGLDDELAGRYLELRRSVEALWAGLQRIGKAESFEQRLYESQRALETMHQASELERAITGAISDPTRAADVVRLYAEPLIEGRGRRLRLEDIPVDRRVRALLLSLAKTRDGLSLLGACADHVLRAAIEDPEPIRRWQRAVGAQLDERAGSRPLVVLRVTIHAAPDRREGFVVADATYLLRSGPVRTPYPLPQRVQSIERLVETIIAIQGRFKARLIPQLTKRDCVLSLELPDELIFHPFEVVTSRQHSLLNLFACVTLRPLGAGDPWPLGDVVVHPAYTGSNSAFVDHAIVGIVGDVVGDRSCVFAAEPAWRPTDTRRISPLVEGFGPYSLAVLLHASEISPSLEDLFEGRAERPVLELFDRVTELRAARRGRYTILWDDPDYSPPDPASI